MKNLINRFGFVHEIRDDAESTRTISFIISDETRDRHGTVLNMDGWDLENYKKNPIVGYQHELYGSFLSDTNPDNVIGSGNVFIDKKKLIGEATFEPEKINPLAEKIFQKILLKTLRAASVGFIPKGKGAYGKDKEGPGEPDETYYYAGQELLEFSIVNVPSNPNATKRKIFQQFGEMLLNFFTPEQLKKMTVEELLNYSEAVQRENISKPVEEKKTPQDYNRMRMTLDLINL